MIVKTGCGTDGALHSTSADPAELTLMVCMTMSRTGCWPRKSSRICFPSLVSTSSRGDRLDTSTPRPARPYEVRMAALGKGGYLRYNIYTHTGGCCPSPDFTHDVQQSLLKQHCAEIDIETATARTPAATCPHKHTAAHRHQPRHPGTSNLLSTSS